MSVVGRGVVEGHLTTEEVSDLARQGLERLPLDGRRVLVLIPDGTRTMPMPLMFDILERELGAARGGARLPRRARHAHADERRAAQPSRRTPRSSTAAAGRSPDLQPPVGRPGDVLRRSERFRRETIEELSARTPEARTCRSRSIAWSSNTTTSSSAVRSFRTRSSASRAAPSTCFRASPRPEIIHFTHWLGALITSSDVHRHDRHAGARRDQPRRRAARDAAVAPGARRDLRRRGGRLLRRRHCNHDAWRQAAALSGQAPRRLARQAVRPCARGDAGDVSTTCGRPRRASTRRSRPSPTAARSSSTRRTCAR